MRKPGGSAAIAALALLAAACGTVGPPAALPAVGDYEVSYTAAECPFPLLIDAVQPECGYLSVPENRDRPEGRRLRLAVAVFGPLESEKHPPVFYLEGGPGNPVLGTLLFIPVSLVSLLAVERRVVVFDHRGVGFSDPALSCPGSQRLLYELLAAELPAEERLARNADVLQECRKRWVEDGIDLTRYNSAESAADAADLRAALGYDEWDLYGVSYGTRLALTVMRDHPEGVRSVVLDSVYPPEIDMTALLLRGAAGALDKLFSACAADPYCSSAYGDLEELLFSTVDRLNESPAEMEFVEPTTRESHPVLLDGAGLLDLVFQSLYSDYLYPRIPRLLSDVRDGDYLLAESLLLSFLGGYKYFSIGQFLSVQCHEEVPYSDPELLGTEREAHPRLASLLDGLLFRFYAAEFCSGWGAGVGAPIEAEPVTSGIPALVLAGGLDPITPPDFGRSVAERLDNAWFVEFPALAHGVAHARNGCPRSIMLAFLEDPGAEPDAACVSAAQGILFECGGKPVVLGACSRTRKRRRRRRCGEGGVDLHLS